MSSHQLGGGLPRNTQKTKFKACKVTEVILQRVLQIVESKSWPSLSWRTNLSPWTEILNEFKWSDTPSNRKKLYTAFMRKQREKKK